MNRDEFVEIVSNSLKLIRTENDYSQEKMAEILGLSKKTLVEIEKGRKPLSWSVAVALCLLFNDSTILKMHIGDEPENLIKTIAFTNYSQNKKQTLGGNVWWNEVEKKNGFRIQQNVISQHYRLIDQNDLLRYSSFDKEYIRERFSELTD